MNKTDTVAASKPNNIIIVGVMFGAVVLGFAVFLVYLLFTAPSPERVVPAGDGGQDEILTLVVKDPPEVLTAALSHTPGEMTADVVGVTTPSVEGQYIVWELINTTGSPVATGVVNNTEIKGRVLVSEGDNLFGLRLRVSDGYLNSEWFETYEVGVTAQQVASPNLSTGKNAGAGGVNTEATPYPAYYDTDWAKGVDNSVEALGEAIQKAWGATEYTISDYYNLCMGLNIVLLSPGQMAPPIPSVSPEEYILKYSVEPYGNNKMNVQYIWCEQ